MVHKQDLRKISEMLWEIPQSFREDMRVPVHIFASEYLLEEALDDKSLTQAINAATLPGLAGPVIVMPDVHQGYGFPIGGVAATTFPSGIISPGAIGYDINCGVRLLSSRIRLEDVEDNLSDLATALDASCPSGVGVGGSVRLTIKELERVCREGSKWALKNGFANRQDLERTEENGCIAGRKPQR